MRPCTVAERARRKATEREQAKIVPVAAREAVNTPQQQGNVMKEDPHHVSVVVDEPHQVEVGFISSRGCNDEEDNAETKPKGDNDASTVPSSTSFSATVSNTNSQKGAESTLFSHQVGLKWSQEGNGAAGGEDTAETKPVGGNDSVTMVPRSSTSFSATTKLQEGAEWTVCSHQVASAAGGGGDDAAGESKNNAETKSAVDKSDHDATRVPSRTTSSTTVSTMKSHEGVEWALPWHRVASTWLRGGNGAAALGQDTSQKKPVDDDDATVPSTSTSSSTTAKSQKGVEWTLCLHRIASIGISYDDDSSVLTVEDMPEDFKKKQPRRRWLLLVLVAVLLAGVVGVAMVAISDKRSAAAAAMSEDEQEGSVEADAGNTAPDDGNNVVGEQPDIESDYGYTDIELPTSLPTSLPPTFEPTSQPAVFKEQTIIFYVTGDAPYDSSQADKLRQYMQDIPDDASFVVHVGDVRSSNQECQWSEYEEAADILFESQAPVFMLVGDNDVLDCPNVDTGLDYWRRNLDRFWEHWDSPPAAAISSLPDVAGTWTFVYERILFIGVHLTGTSSPKVRKQTEWCIDLIEDYVQDMDPYTGRVVIFGHAGPMDHHEGFFDDLAEYFRYNLHDSLPLLYIQGDTHEWDVERPFYGRSSWMKLTVEGEAREAPTRIQVTSTGNWQGPDDAFRYERRW